MSAPADAVPGPSADGGSPSPRPKKKGGMFLSLLIVILVVPAACYYATDLLIVPKLKQALLAAVSEEKSTGHGAHAAGESAGGKKASDTPVEHVAEFGATVVNVGGATSSRYLRVNFAIASKDAGIGDIIKERQSALRDATINTLSSLPLQSLDSETTRNNARNELIDQFNRVLGSQVVSQIYFSEFVVQ